ncbi:MAG: hypothetical protein HY043_12220 [Verrucomicrobia bacterium]|nr:hypothetical protein [Verrucomicrobiota bacterium]
MTWITQLELLHMMQRCFPEPNLLELTSEPAPESQLRTVFEQVELSQRDGVDAAIRVFSRTGKWPTNLSSPEKYFLSRRIEFAIWVALALVAPDESGERSIVPNPPSSFDREEQVEWLLIWAWRVPGIKFWLEKSVLNERLARRSP